MLTAVHVFGSCLSQNIPCEQRFLSNMAFSITFLKLFASLSLVSRVAGLFTPQEKPLRSAVCCFYWALCMCQIINLLL